MRIASLILNALAIGIKHMRTDAKSQSVEVFSPGEFDADRHYYARTLNAQIHPLVASFFDMSLDRLLSRFCHLNPAADEDDL